MIILALDIDDCIFPNNNSYFGRLDDNLEILKMNMKRIQMMIEKYKIQIFITSSWHTHLTLNSDLTISYNNRFEGSGVNKEYYAEEASAFEIMREVLDGHVIGLSKGNRYVDIKNLLENGCIVVSFDDMDLSFDKLNVSPELESNYKFIELAGFITNDKTCEINKFMKKHNRG